MKVEYRMQYYDAMVMIKTVLYGSGPEECNINKQITYREYGHRNKLLGLIPVQSRVPTL